ncbi:unnamed protein product [Danaus chrysippus]|uniref:(African queen) hypothetical protein n=1 Tax=Danaus chrysippus TaxID=151541 RepID=A0A8J2QKS8_9NEOP|nr:unnamed protein product [Danaus chrysippus]
MELRGSDRRVTRSLTPDVRLVVWKTNYESSFDPSLYEYKNDSGTKVKLIEAVKSLLYTRCTDVCPCSETSTRSPHLMQVLPGFAEDHLTEETTCEGITSTIGVNLSVPWTARWTETIVDLGPFD